MTVLRFQKDVGVLASDIIRQLPAGSFTSVSMPSPSHMVDVDVAPTGVGDAVAWMSMLGYSLFATDPVPSLAAAAAAAIPPVDRIVLSDGAVLTIGACLEGQSLTRSGSNLVGSQAQYDARNQLVADHFVSGNLDLDEIGIMGWRSLVGGTGADLALGGEAGHPGIIDLGSGTAAAGRCAVYLGEAALPSFSLIGSGQNPLSSEWLIRFNAAALASSNLERFTMGFGDGWDNADGVEHSNGIYCEFDPTTSPNFRLTTASASLRTKATTSVAVVASTWYRIGINITFPGLVPTAQLFINGNLRATNTLNYPSLGLGVGIRLDGHAGALEPRVQLDYVTISQITNKET